MLESDLARAGEVGQKDMVMHNAPRESERQALR
jgi:hypothetical protein